MSPSGTETRSLQQFSWLTYPLKFAGILVVVVVIISIIIIITILDRPVSASSNSLFKGLPNRLRPFGLFNITFGIQLFVLVTRRSQFDLYLLSFSSIGLLSALPKVVIPSVAKKGVADCSSEKFGFF
jgi:hypothetical protein